MTSTQNQYNPDYCIRPGEILTEAIAERDITQLELAQRTGRSPKTINEIIQGKAAITPETALQLERVLGITAKFWMNLQSNYQAFEIKNRERERLSGITNWLDTIPVKSLIKQKWIEPYTDKVLQLEEVLNFFGIATPEIWNEQWLAPNVDYRRSPSFEKDPGAVSAWLRRGEILAQQIDCVSFDSHLFQETLIEIKGLTREPQSKILSEVPALAAAAGVAVVFVPCIPKAPISGASRWLSSNKAIIQLSLRHGTDDHFWFTFFHEAGHVLLHGKRETFIDDDDQLSDLKEHEANEFATDVLMPSEELNAFIAKRNFDRESIVAFADKIGIAPGIVLGKLQRHKLVGHGRLSDLKRTIAWTAI